MPKFDLGDALIDLLGLQVKHVNHFFLLRFISIKNVSVDKLIVFNDLVTISVLKYTKMPPHLHFYLDGKVNRNQQSKILKLEKLLNFGHWNH